MTEQTITIGKASAKLSDVLGLKKAFTDRCKYLSDLYVEPENRKKGAATKFMRQITKEAEEAKVTLVLNPAPDFIADGEITEAKLVEFYKQFKFVELQKKPLLLVRWVQVDIPKPVEKPRILTFS